MNKAATSQSLSPRQSIAVGITLFSMFFGAGNLILPPMLALQAGTSTVPAMIGFLVAGIGLPVLGIVAVALVGTARELADRVHPLFSSIFVAAIYLAIGPCLAIPRTSSTAFEMLFPQGAPIGTIRLVFSIVFFAVAYALAMHPGALTKLLGRITGPALIILLVMVVGPSLVSPAGVAQAPQAPYDSAAPIQGFLTGYQTMDLLASLTFGLVIAENIKGLGVSDSHGLMREISTLHFGIAGTLIIAAIYLLACLNVCIGLISCCGTYFAETFGAAAPGAQTRVLGRIPYAGWAAAFAIFSCVVSNVGLDAILTFSVPLLSALYPVSIVFVIMGMAHHACDRLPLTWPWAIGATTVASVATALRDAFFADTWLPFDALPLASLGFGWLLPALCGAAVGAILSATRTTK